MINHSNSVKLEYILYKKLSNTVYCLVFCKTCILDNWSIIMRRLHHKFRYDDGISIKSFVTNIVRQWIEWMLYKILKDDISWRFEIIICQTLNKQLGHIHKSKLFPYLTITTHKNIPFHHISPARDMPSKRPTGIKWQSHSHNWYWLAKINQLLTFNKSTFCSLKKPTYILSKPDGQGGLVQSIVCIPPN